MHFISYFFSCCVAKRISFLAGTSSSLEQCWHSKIQMHCSLVDAFTFDHHGLSVSGAVEVMEKFFKMFYWKSGRSALHPFAYLSSICCDIQ